jgi:hypothetical protein
MDDAIDRFDAFDKLQEAIQVLLRLCDPGSSTLRTAEEVRVKLPVLAAKIGQLGGRRAKQVARYLTNRVEGLCSYLAELADALGSCGHDAARLSGQPARRPRAPMAT